MANQLQRRCRICNAPLSKYNSGEICFHHPQDESTAKILEDPQSRYDESEKGKDVQKRYHKSVKGQKAHKRYTASDSGRLTYYKYYRSPKGQEAVQRAADQRKLKKQLAKQIEDWLQENPGKTVDNYFEEHQSTTGGE